MKTLDIAKRLLDHNMHPPTVYFPLLVDEALMVEPTETETRESLDRFADAVESILAEAEEDPEIARQAPYTTPVRRLDEAAAARNPVVRQEFDRISARLAALRASSTARQGSWGAPVELQHGREEIAVFLDPGQHLVGGEPEVCPDRRMLRRLDLVPAQRRRGGRAARGLAASRRRRSSSSICSGSSRRRPCPGRSAFVICEVTRSGSAFSSAWATALAIGLRRRRR